MWDSFAVSVALRQLRYGLTQTFLTMGVVAISVTLIIFLGSLIGGLQKMILETVTESIPNIVISQPKRMPLTPRDIPSMRDSGKIYIGSGTTLEERTQKIEDWMIWLPRLERFDPSITAVSPVVEGQAILSAGANQRGVQVTGIVPERHNRVVDIESKLTAGRFFGLRPGEIVIGYQIADDFGLKVGDRVRLSTSGGNTFTYRVAGIFNTGMPTVDDLLVFVTLGDAQSLFELGNAVTSIDIKLSNIFEANTIADRLKLQVPYKIDSWMRENQELLTALSAQSQSSNLILVFTTLAAGFGIASILITAVTSKLREIGILRAIGATRKQIIGIFTLQSTMLAVIGGILGAGLGIGLSLAAYRVRAAQAGPGRESQVFPIDLRWQLVTGAIAIAIAVGFLASLYPAWRAAKVNPIEVIRGQ
jgi:lipoprotein-releasing system permease protein